MVSGIGPKGTLDGLNIPVIADRPGVGQNMQDHLIVGASYPVNVITHQILGSDPVFAEEQVINYLTNRSGMLTNSDLSIASNDTADIPLIYPDYLDDVRDQEVIVAGWKRAQEIWQTSALKSITTGPVAWPGAHYTTDKAILQLVRDNAFHESATNKMGRPNDTLEVIDPQCQVYGVTGLRVVDSSSFSFIPPSHIQATVYALAEKISSDIIAFW
ncbi:hypothetical protein ZTR_04464 [Talaromyces verruculosus]|nr:hypothetical protein ZTR_04464 [Talaromyces verruculosus]